MHCLVCLDHFSVLGTELTGSEICFPITLQVSPVMTAEELTNQVLEMRNVAASLDIWLTFEVLENGELGECSCP